MKKLYKSSVFLMVLFVLSQNCLISGCQAAGTLPTPIPDDDNSGIVHGEYALSAIEKDAFGAFVDQFMKDNMEKYKVPGVTFSMVKNNEVLLKKGYGYADVKGKKAVDPDRHKFRIASVSKTFTAQSVLKLHEGGKLDLNKGVNGYLDDYALDVSQGEITADTLLKHASGLEETLVSYTYDESRYMKLGEYIHTVRSRQYQRPETYVQYSNLGYNALGYLVQKVSGLPFEEYACEQVFKPLGMDNSGFSQNVSTDDRADFAVNYYSEDGEFQAYPWICINETPAGGMYTTASDMARYLKYQLSDNADKTVKLMQTQHFSNHKLLGGFGYGMYHMERNGQSVWMQEGNGLGFHAMLVMLPGQKIGYFMAINSDSEQILRDFEDAFLNHYFPRKDNAAPKAMEGFEKHAAVYVGKYWDTRHNHGSILKLRTLGFDEYSLSYRDGKMIFTHPLGEDEYVEVATGVLQDIRHPEQFLIIHTKADGSVGFISGNPGGIPMTFERINGWQSMDIHVPLNVVLCLYFLLAILVGVILWVIGLIKNRGPRKDKAVIWSGWMLWITCVLIAFTMLNIIIIGATFNTAEPDVLWQTVALAAANLAALLVPVIAFFCIRAWVKKEWTWIRRTYYSITVLFLFGYVWIFFFWNLAGYRLQ